MNVPSLFSFEEFNKIAARDEADFADFGTTVTQGSGEGNTYTFADNGSNVLGVAHLDTVQAANHSSILRVGKERVLLSPRLDDRLGVYIITKLLPRMGITCDWLLTTGEESGQSSAENFIADKTYNWAFSFDRAGTDVVLYQFDHKPLRRILRKAGFKVGDGTFSDLSFLDVGCSGINFGCGYHDCHSINAYAFLSDTCRQVKLFAAFYAKYEATKLPYNHATPWSSYTRGYNPYASSGWPYSNGYAQTYGRGYVTKYDQRGRDYLDWADPDDPYARYRDGNGSVDYEQWIDDAQGSNGSNGSK